MKRRDLLATGAALALGAVGGCTGCARGPVASLRMTTVDDDELARRATHFRPEPGSPDYELVREVVENGSATVERTEPLLPTGEPFVFRDAVYELSREVVRSRPATTFSVTLNPVEDSVDQSETVRFDDLPAVDRRKFVDHGWADDPFLGFGSSLLFLDSEIPDSALVPDPDASVIVWNGKTRGRFEVDGSWESSLKIYRLTAETVNPSASDYGRQVRERHEFTLSGLSPEQRAIVDQARKEGFSVPPDESPPDAVWRLADRFQTQRPVRDDHDSASGTYVVRYEGSVYWTRLSVPAERGTGTR